MKGLTMKPGRGWVVVSLSSAMLLAVAFTSTAKASTSVSKGDLLAQSGKSDCPRGGAGGGPVHGFAVLNESESSEGIIVDVSLQGGLPNTSYDVHLIQCEANTDAPGESMIGTLETDSQGNGTFEGSADEVGAGVQHAFVGLCACPPSAPLDVFATGPLPV